MLDKRQDRWGKKIGNPESIVPCVQFDIDSTTSMDKAVQTYRGIMSQKTSKTH